MAQYATLKAAIDQYITTNGNNEITGAVLNGVLDTIVDSLGANYQFAGVATPSTNPGTPDQNVFYFAFEAGTYTNFNNTVLPAGISTLLWNGSWTAQTWFAIDDEPTAGSDNLVKSGGVFGRISDSYGYFGVDSGFVNQNKVFFSIDRSKHKPTNVKFIRFKHGTDTIQFWKVTVTETRVLAPVAITAPLTFASIGEDYVNVDVELAENEYIGVSGNFAYLGSGAPYTSGYESVPFEGADITGGDVGFTHNQALGFQALYLLPSYNSERITENEIAINQNTSDILNNSQIELKEHIDTLLDLQNLEHIEWDSYTSYATNEAIYVNLLRHNAGKITDIYYKTNGGTTDFVLVTEENGIWTETADIQSNTEEVKGSAFIAHCKLTTPVILGEGQYIAIRRNVYYSNNINDKAYTSVDVGSPVIYQNNQEIAYLAVDETLQGKSLIKDTAIELLSPDDFIKNIGHTFEDGHVSSSTTYRNSGLVDVSSFYRIIASFQTQGIGTTYGPAIILYDNHFNVVKTYSAFTYLRNCLFDFFITKEVKYMLINSYYDINGADYTTYTCYAYKRIVAEKNQNILYKKIFNSSVVYPEYTNATDANFTANGLLINSITPIRLNKYYSLQTRTIRILLKLNGNSIFKVSSSDGISAVIINTATATMTMQATTPQSVEISDFSSDYQYLLEITRDYAKNIAKITNINKGTTYKIEHTENGQGGAGQGGFGTDETAGLWHDYYEFSCESGSTLIKEINVSPLYGKVKTLLYGDSVTELLYYPSADYPNSWVQQFISLCADRVMVSPRGGTSIADILLRLPNELPYIDAEYVMVTIGTNGGITYNNLSQLIELIFKFGATPVLNHIPCNINSGGTSNHAEVNAIIDEIREKYGIYGVDFDIATSVNLDGQNVDTNKMWWEDYSEPTGSVYHHPNVLGSNAMIAQLKQDMPELLI